MNKTAISGKEDHKKAKLIQVLKISSGLIQALANLAVVFGIYFAYHQITQSNESDKKRTAIEAVSQVRSSDFLKAFARLKTNSYDSTPEGQHLKTDDINYVTNMYDHIARLYTSDLAEKCIVKDSTYYAIKDLSVICDKAECPPKNQENIVALLYILEREPCR
jgi:hypothetical protein